MVGEYENGIQILFFESDGHDILVFDGGFYRVNKPAQMNLSGFSDALGDDKITYHLFRMVHKFTLEDEEPIDETYILLDDAVIKIAWAFATASGQREETFWMYRASDKIYYDQSLVDMESAREMEITDLRFI